MTQEHTGGFRRPLSGNLVVGDIVWNAVPTIIPAKEFRIPLTSASSEQLTVSGWYNPGKRKLSFTVYSRQRGRIYSLDMGLDHTNPDDSNAGGTHKHYWSEADQSRWAYAPSDITEPWNRPVAVWRQFCAESGLEHHGQMLSPDEPRGWQ